MKIGTDIVEIGRVKTAVDRTGQPFLERVFTPFEIEYCRGKTRFKYESLAARFAAKEAFSKAMGTGIGENAHLTEIEVHNLESGKPVLILSGETLEYFNKTFSGMSVDVSLSHTAKLAVATVIIG